MKLKLLVGFVSIAALIGSAVAADTLATQNKGAENIEMYGGKRGPVPFPHHQHQAQLGGIVELKAEGKLKKKYVMNKLCTKCHRETKRAGRKSGPTTCTKCHIK